MKVKILNMNNVRHYRPKGNASIIRISDGGYELDPIDYQYDFKLLLDFYDIEPSPGQPVNWNCFSAMDGKQLILFFDVISAAKCDELVIHCYAGLSRSPAVAIAYGWYIGDYILVDSVLSGHYIPNNQVLRVMSSLIFEDVNEARSKYNYVIKRWEYFNIE